MADVTKAGWWQTLLNDLSFPTKQYNFLQLGIIFSTVNYDRLVRDCLIKRRLKVLIQRLHITYSARGVLDHSQIIKICEVSLSWNEHQLILIEFHATQKRNRILYILILFIVVSVMSVSYTHLDVYKRQFFFFSSSTSIRLYIPII